MAGNNQLRKFTFSCEINSLRNIRNNEEVKEHENVQDMKIFPYQYCNYTSKWKQNIKRHEKTQHQKTQNGKEEIVYEDNETCLKKYEKERKSDVIFSCKYCKYTSKHKENIQWHELRHDDIWNE